MVNLFSLAAGTYSGAVTVTDPAAANSPEAVEIALTVKSAGTDAVPFGAFEAPADGSSFGASIVLSGWALDDVAMRAVKIFRKTGEKTKTLLGKAVFVAGARPDIETEYPSYPQNYKAGWSYTLKASRLPGGGAGAFTIQAYAVDTFGHSVLLGEKTLTGTGAAGSPGAAVMTLGEHDILEEDRIAAGFTVWIDGMAAGHSVDGGFREGFPNKTKYADGWHTIAWNAADSSGGSGAIRSWYFKIDRRAETARASQTETEDEDSSPVIGRREPAVGSVSGIAAIPIEGMAPVFLKSGFADVRPAETVYPDADGSIRIRFPRLSRLAIYLNREQSFESEAEERARAARILAANRKDSRFRAYALVGVELRPLPIGASFDAGDGILYWQPGPGFFGEHRFVILDAETLTRKAITVTIFNR